MSRPHIVILGAGLGGAIAAFEIKEALGAAADITVVNQGDTFSFVPSNPWVAVGWRTREAIEVKLGPVLARKGVGFRPVGAAKVDPAQNKIDLDDGSTVTYDYLVVATGPDLAFDEIPGLGPHGGHTQSICRADHAEMAHAAFEGFCQAPGPIVVGAVQGASCFGPAYEFAMILNAELRKRRIRDKVPMTFVTSEPYIGHLGLDGVGDTKGLLESAMRDRDIQWITNSKITAVEPGVIHAEEVNDDGSTKAKHDLPFSYAMILPAFRGVAALRGIEGLTNPRGFVIVDKTQRNPTYPNVYALGVCIAIAPTGKTPVPVGVPKTGFMIESMVTAIAANLKQTLAGQTPTNEATWNAICLADFGDGGVAFFAQPQIPPRNVNWASKGKWVHTAKGAFEAYFLNKIRHGESQPFYEKWALDLMGARKIRDRAA